MLPWLRPYRGALVLGTVAMLFTNALSALGPWVLKLGIDSLEGATGRPVRDWALLLVAVLFGRPGPVFATDLLDVRHWSSPDHTRIVIDLAEPGSYRHREFDDPPRIAVDVNEG